MSKITSICHRRTAAGLEFAVVECLPLKSGEMKSVLNSGHKVREVLQTFMRDQRQVLNLWNDDVKAQVREHLDEKYPTRTWASLSNPLKSKWHAPFLKREWLLVKAKVAV